MEHSERYEMVRNYYQTFRRGRRLWSKDRVKQAAKYGWITDAEVNEILKEG